MSNSGFNEASLASMARSLAEAVQSGDLSSVRTALASGAAANPELLKLALKSNNLDIIKELVKSGADPKLLATALLKNANPSESVLPPAVAWLQESGYLNQPEVKQGLNMLKSVNPASAFAAVASAAAITTATTNTATTSSASSGTLTNHESVDLLDFSNEAEPIAQPSKSIEPKPPGSQSPEPEPESVEPELPKSEPEPVKSEQSPEFQPFEPLEEPEPDYELGNEFSQLDTTIEDKKPVPPNPEQEEEEEEEEGPRWGDLYKPSQDLDDFTPVPLLTDPLKEEIQLTDDFDTPVLAPAITAPQFDWSRFQIRDSLPFSTDLIPELLDKVITNYTPYVRTRTPECANALFLVFRHTFYCGTEHAFVELASAAIRRIELKVFSESSAGDIGLLVHWLANTLILLYYIRKDGASAGSLNSGTAREFQPALEQLAASIINRVYEACTNLLNPMISACILDYDSIPEYNNVQYKDEWKLFRSKKKDDGMEIVQQHMLPPTPESLVKCPGPARVSSTFASILGLFHAYSVHSTVQMELLAQLLYYVASQVFNGIMKQRKRYLSRRRAMQIRLNISVLEDWCRNNNFRPPNEKVQFKSLIETGKTFLLPVTKLLAFLQTFSSFDDSPGSVTEALNLFSNLNPALLLQASSHYRYELGEKRMSKEYKRNLQQMARAFDAECVTKGLEQAALEPATTMLYTTDVNKCFVALKYELPRSTSLVLSENLGLPYYIPNLTESNLFWGAKDVSGLIAAQGAQYLVPEAPPMLEDFPRLAVEKRDEEKLGGDVDVPALATKKPVQGDEAFDDNPWAVW